MIFLNFFIVLSRPTKIDSPIKKWPILNSLIPEILASIFADLYVNPCPAWTSNPNLFPVITAD